MIARSWKRGLVMTATVILRVLAKKEMYVYFMNSDGVANGRIKWTRDCRMFKVSEHIEACTREAGACGELRVELECTPKTFLCVANLFNMQFTKNMLSGDDVVDILVLAKNLRLRSGDEKTSFYRNLARATEVDSSVLKKVERLKSEIPDASVYALQLLRECAGAQGINVRIGRQHAVLCEQSSKYCCYGSAEKVETIVSVKVHYTAASALASEKNSLQEVLRWFIKIADVSALDMQGCRVSGLIAWASGLERLRELDMIGSGIGLQDLADFRSLPNLKKLNISCNRLRRRTLAGMCMDQSLENGLSAFVSLARLSSLSIAYCGFSVQDIMQVGKIRSLQELDVSGNNVDKECVSVLCRLENLKLLRMVNCRLAEGSLVHLRRLANLRSLHVSQNKLSKEDIAGIGTLRNLVLLRIDNCCLTKGSLAQLQGLVQLRSLCVSRNRLDGEDIISIRGIQSLRVLDMQDCSVRSRELSQLQGELVELNVSGVQLVAESASAIGRMRGLRRLYMHRCRVKRGVLARLGELKNLEHLSVSHARLGVEDVAAIGRMASLKELNMCRCKVEQGSLCALEGLVLLRRLNVCKTPLSVKDQEAVQRMRNTEVVGMEVESSVASSFVFMWPYGEASLRHVFGRENIRKNRSPGDEGSVRGGNACASRTVRRNGETSSMASERRCGERAGM